MPNNMTQKLWKCSECGYTQDFEPHIDNMRKHFNDDQLCKLSDCGHYECPSCAMRGVRDIEMKEM